jgi:hypothetical protein
LKFYLNFKFYYCFKEEKDIYELYQHFIEICDQYCEWLKLKKSFSIHKTNGRINQFISIFHKNYIHHKIDLDDFEIVHLLNFPLLETDEKVEKYSEDLVKNFIS